MGLFYNFNYFFGEKRGVVNGFMRVFAGLGDEHIVKKIAANVIEERPGVTVRRANNYMGDGNAGFFAGGSAGVRGNIKGEADEIAKHERDFVTALLQDDRLGFERIVNAGGIAFLVITGH